MRAVVMAGGQGRRARPFTEYFPKAMLPVRGRPLIEYITSYLESFEIITDITVMADVAGLGAQIKNHYSNHEGKPVRFVQDGGEGTGGDLRYAGMRGDFLLWFTDNLCAIDLPAMAETYRSTGSSACIATRSRRREETGFARVDQSGIIERFEEKPVVELPYHECLGIYILGDTVMDIIQGRDGPLNLSYDVLEGLAQTNTVSSYDIGDADWVDVESPVVLERYHSRILHITERMERPSSARTRR